MAKYKILAGRHAGKVNGSVKIFNTGEIVESDVDLVAKFNRPNSRKFELVDSAGNTSTQTVTQRPNVTPMVVTPNVDSLSLKDLQALAAEEEIDIKGLTKREDIVKVIKNALN